MGRITQALEKAARERERVERLARSQPGAPCPTPTPPDAMVAAGPPPVVANGDAAGRVVFKVDPHVVAHIEPDSPITEQYRILRTNLQHAEVTPVPRVVMVTSAVHSEGKTITSVNLAFTLAQDASKRVLLVDGDLRKGTVRRVLGLDAQPGLADYLADGAVDPGPLVSVGLPNLQVWAAGALPRNPVELLGSQRMQEVLKGLRTRFDIVILDSPPVLPVTDAGVIGQQVDGVILVVRAGRTQRRVVEEAHQRLRQMKIRLLGTVLTHVDYYVPGYRGYYYYRREVTPPTEA